MKQMIEKIKDIDGKFIVFINDIKFKGKRSINWKEVKEYLKTYVSKFYEIAESKEIIYIGSDFPDEYTGSNYTYKLKGTVAKAKANATQGLKEIIEIATNKKSRANDKEKHRKDAKYGWYKYDSRIALPVFNGDVLVRYNVFNVSLIIRHDKNGKKYLYDIIDIKKRNEQLAT